ncbi:hypothetical protein RQM65_06415 [Pricia sp. S334]|uniref:Lamin tail domain-containing protein n=1 Tax=Pricia mediterranea TaxID=3076079 RepID=A0ABU3L3G2_9FLAO|nr:hypothetical protein [Pricia sp. S334]MDT7828291.1 hypothetical protein [Pricia sp. S334]
MKFRSPILFLIALFLFACSKSSDNDEVVVDPVIEAELVHYIYEIDTVNKTFTWDYEVKFRNVSEVDASGFAVVYHRDVVGDFTFQNTHPDGAQCFTIKAGEECIYSFYESAEYDADLMEPGKNVEFERGEYFFEE